jgi:hypothetical protein
MIANPIPITGEKMIKNIGDNVQISTEIRVLDYG